MGSGYFSLFKKSKYEAEPVVKRIESYEKRFVTLQNLYNVAVLLMLVYIILKLNKKL